MFSTSHIHVFNVIGPQHFLCLIVHSGIGDAMAPPYKLLTLLTKLLAMFARWHISLLHVSIWFDHQLMNFWSFMQLARMVGMGWDHSVESI